MNANDRTQRTPPVRESAYSVILRNDFTEILMVLNEHGMFTKHGVQGFDGIAVKRRGWGCPGGGAEKGENSRGAAIRETRQEASIDVVIDESNVWVSTPVRDYHRKTYFLVESFEGTPRLNPEFKKEIIQVEWVPAELFLYRDDKDDVFFQGQPIYRGHARMLRELLKHAGIIKA